MRKEWALGFSVGLMMCMVAILLVVYVPEASAVPSFSREHDLSCTACHAGFPRLNRFGMQFKQRGYRILEDPGDFVWKKPTPFGGIVEGLFKYEEKETAGESTPATKFLLEKVALLSATTLAPGVSYFLEITGREGKNFEAESAFAIVDLFMIMKRYLVLETDTRSIVNLQVGRYHVDNFFLSDPRRLTLAGYRAQIQPGVRGVSLSPDVVGAEFNGFYPIGFRYALGVRNLSKTFIPKVENERTLAASYLWVNQSLLGQTISFLYTHDARGDKGAGTDDDTQGWGASLDLHFLRFDVIGALYWYREGSRIPSPIKATSALVELTYPFSRELIGLLRYDSWNQSHAAPRESQFVAHLSYYAAPNVRAVVEYSLLEFDNFLVADNDERKIQLALLFGF